MSEEYNGIIDRNAAGIKCSCGGYAEITDPTKAIGEKEMITFIIGIFIGVIWGIILAGVLSQANGDENDSGL